MEDMQMERPVIKKRKAGSCDEPTHRFKERIGGHADKRICTTSTNSTKLQVAEKELELLKLKQQVAEKELEVLKLREQTEEEEGTPKSETEKQILNPSVAQVVKEKDKGKEKFIPEEDERINYRYVVTRGPRIGIHRSYTTVADLSSSDYVMAQSECEANVIWKQVTEERARIDGNIERARKLIMRRMEEPLYKEGIDLEEWINIHNKVKKLGPMKEGDVIKIKGLAKAIVYEGASQKMVDEIISAGLMDTLYLDPQLNCLKSHAKLQSAIRVFCKNVKLDMSKQRIYLKFESSIPDWEDGHFLAGYSFIRMGVVGKIPQIYTMPIPEDIPKEEDLLVQRLEGLCNIHAKLLEIEENSEVKVNFDDGRTILVSRCKKKISKDDLGRISAWKTRIEKKGLKIVSETKKAMVVEDEEPDFPKDAVAPHINGNIKW